MANLAKRTISCWACGVLALCLLLGAAAHGATFTATFTGVGLSRAFQFDLTGHGTTSTKAGAYDWQRTGGDWTGVPGIGDSFSTFCVDLPQSIRTGNSYTYEVVDLADAPVPAQAPLAGPMGQAKAAAITELWVEHHSLLTTSDDFAAFGVAVWEIVYDDVLDLSAGDFQALTTAGFVTTAQTWLNALDGVTDGVVDGQLMALSSQTSQDQAFLAVVSSPLVPIPTPSALWGGAALLGVLAYRRQARRAAL